MKQLDNQTKLIIFNADDLGMSIGTNKGIEIAHKNGVLTSASLMVTTPAFKHALSIIKKNPQMGIGAHLSLTLGKSIISPKNIPLLVNKEGFFKLNFLSLLLSTYLHKDIIPQIKLELSAQIKFMKDHGVDLDHINSQGHVHMIPKIFTVTCSLANQYNIPTIRLSNEYISPKLTLENPPSLLNIIKTILLKYFSTINTRGNTFKATDFMGILYSGHMTKKIIIELIKNCSFSRPVEILSHPAFFDTGPFYSYYQKIDLIPFLSSKERMKELEALTNKSLTNELSDLKTGSFRSIQPIK